MYRFFFSDCNQYIYTYFMIGNVMIDFFFLHDTHDLPMRCDRSSNGLFSSSFSWLC